MTGERRDDVGFTLIEVLVSMGVVMVVASIAAGIVGPATRTAVREPDVIDVQQRARAGVEMLLRDLHRAGAGLTLGPATGGLGGFLPPIVPRRMGLLSPDRRDVARPDAIMIAMTAGSRSQSRLLNLISASSLDLRTEPSPNCPGGAGPCGIGAGSSLMIFDGLGHFDFFTVVAAQSGIGRLRPWQAATPVQTYPAGAAVSEAEWHLYYLDIQNRQLRHFDGYLTDTPVVDDVVGLGFEYWGDPAPPMAPRPPLGTANCLFDAAGQPAGLPTLLASDGSLTALPLALFTDGPWCGAGQNQFDADLLRIRKVRVTLQVRAHNPLARVGDYALRFDVSPRNLGGSR
jgi:hypothetical protein